MGPVLVLGGAGMESAWRTVKLRPPTPPDGGVCGVLRVVSLAVSLLPLSPNPQCSEERAEKLVCFRSPSCTGETCSTRSVLIGMNVALPEKQPEHDVWKVGFYEAGLVSDAPGRVCKGVSNQ